MKLGSSVDIFRRKDELRLINLEYIIICHESGQPIFTKCWGDVCGKLGEKDELLTAFLSAIMTMPAMFAESDKKVHRMSIGSLQLLFNYTSSECIICLAFLEKDIDANTMNFVKHIFKDISNLLVEDYLETHWDRLNDPKVRSFEKELLKKVIHPNFHVASPCDGNMHDENCPVCLPSILRSCS